MKNEMLQQAAEYRKNHKRKTFWYQVVSCMAAVVVFCTTYALILPAITMEKKAICGIEEHAHDDSCYRPLESVLTCSPEIHGHTDSCYDTSGILVCGVADYVIHSHSNVCYNAAGELVCLLDEVSIHVHDSDCYLVETVMTEDTHTHTESCYTSQQGDLVCQESTELHVHTDSCYILCTKTVCGQEESPGHEHGEGCTDTITTQICTVTEHSHIDSCLDPETGSYVCAMEEHGHGDGCYTTETVTVCTLTPHETHTHADGCYETVSEVTCTQSTTEAHVHAEACYEWTSELTCGYEEGEGASGSVPTETAVPILVCTKPEIFVHDHSSNCYDQAGTIICSLLETSEHNHDTACVTRVDPEAESALICQLTEHIHDEVLCFSDTTADVETAADWESTLPETLTGKWDEDLVAIAISQLGYTESTRNVQVDADGRIWGYSRYGDWYGEPYGDWNTTFVSFCLHYAEVTDFPQESNANRMVMELTELELFSTDHSPRLGDLLFLSDDGDDDADRAGIVVQVEETEIKTIEGDTENNCVEYQTYALTDPEILGYGILPEAPKVQEETIQPEIIYYCGQEAHTHGEDCCDADGNLTCELPEHTHNEECQIESEEVTYYCGQEEHTHGEACYDEEDDLTCKLPEHTHSGECCVEPGVYYCSLEEHAHGVACCDADGYILCGLPIHAHTDKCLIQPTYYCGEVEHTHTILCLANLSDLSEEGRGSVERVIRLIDKIPSAHEIDAQIETFEAVGNTDGEEKWLTELYQRISDVYIAYSELGIHLQLYVVNADKLMDLEYIWSAHALIENIASDAPTPTWYTSTKDFIELNLYDYVYGINSNWESNKKYPGFQWNGGAYSNDSGDGDGNDYRYSYTDADDGIANSITDRYYIDSIDFGNSIIANYAYAGSNYVKSTTAMNVGKLYNNSGASSTGKINWLWYNGSDYATTTNRPVGFSTGYESISRKLGNDGYPALTDGTSLAYLFGGTSDSYVIKKNTESIDGLFQQDSESGEYQFNSRTNHAEYTNNFFQLYDDIITPNFITYPFGNFLPLNTINTNYATQVGAFNKNGGMKTYVEGIIADLQEDLDRDDDSNGTAEDYGDTSRKQLKVMLQEYRENWNWFPKNNYGTFYWNDLSPAMAIRDYFNGVSSGGNTPSANVSFVTQEHLDRMYNIDWDVATNFFFGMEMKMTFMQPKDGYTGNDTNDDGESDYPMVFYFTGDDDVWVYIDDVLFLDLTGIHRHVGGKIDFVNGKVYYYELLPSTTGDVSESEYKWYSFAELMRSAGMTDTQIDAVLEPMDANGNRPFKDYTTHTFNFYYMERGSGSSVCRLNFNFPLLKQNSISVTKENTAIDDNGNASTETVLGNPDYYFNIVTPNNELFVGPNSVSGIYTYTIMDSAGNTIGSGETDEYGIFTLKAGQTAVFEGIDENKGDFFVQELIKAEDNAQYPEVYINDVASRYNKLVDWQYRKYFSKIETTDETNPMYTGPYGYQWYGRSGQETDSSSNSTFYFEQQNHVDVSKLGSLSLTKQVQSYTAPLAETYYRMYVMLDDQPLAKDMKLAVTVDGTKIRDAIVGHETVDGKTVSYVEIAMGETVTIPNIISGTKFKIWESDQSSAGYKVDYSQTGADEVEDTATSISGIVRVNADVVVTITNSENGTQIEIPGIKSFNLFAGGSYSYEFVLKEANADGTPIDGGITLTETVEVTANNASFKFDPIIYLKHSYDSLPASHYYVIEETGETANGLDNTQKFLVKVTISQDDSDDGISAEISEVSAFNGTDWTKINGTEFTFTNTLTGDLSLSKKVDGVASGQEFGFIIKLDPGTSGLDSLPTSYQATAYNVDGTVGEVTLNFSDNDTSVVMTHGEKLVIHGIPIGVSWTITEGTVVRAEDGSFTVTGNAPDGYITSVTAGVVGADGVIPDGSTTKGNTAGGSIGIGEMGVIYTNTSTYALPETGGTGTIPYTMAGLMLMLLSAAYLLYKAIISRREVN